jgi:multidrug resistance efflux pump
MRTQRRVIFIAGLIIFLGAMLALGYRYWYQPTYDFYNTDQANVTGSLVHVAAPASGQINDLYFDVGGAVNKDDMLATIKVVSPAPVASAGPSVPRLLARLTSPISGTVATRDVSVGDTIGAGQPIATIVALNQLWVVANVDEARVQEIHVGDVADVELTATGQVFRGKVTELGSATTDVTTPASLGGFGSSDTTKRVPVTIVFDYSGYRLVPGMSATVTVYTHGAP